MGISIDENKENENYEKFQVIIINFFKSFDQ